MTKENNKKTKAQSKTKDALRRKLEQEIAELKESLTELENNWKRALADYRNLERRAAEEKDEATKFANFVLVSELIDVYDNLLMVKKHSKDKGLHMVVAQLDRVLKGAGLNKIEATGKPFDERLMEAIDTRDVDDANKNNVVLEEISAGYQFKGKLVKPARVIVGKFNTETEENAKNLETNEKK